MKHTLHQITLKNNAELLAIDTPGSHTFCFTTYVRAGWDYTPQKIHEMSHLLEHLAFKGNAKYKTEEEFNFAAEKFGTRLNATTADHWIRYEYDGAISQYEQIIALATAQIDKPLFLQEDIVTEKGVVTSELSRKKDADASKVSYELFLNVFPSRLSIDKRISSLKDISRKDIVEYFNTHHVAQNTQIILAGDLSGGRLENITKLLNNFYGSFRTGKKRPWQIKNKSNYAGKIITQESELLNEHHFEVQWIQEKYQPELEPVMRVFMSLLGTGFGSRLFRVSRNTGLSYGAQSYNELEQEYSYIAIKDRTQPQKALKLFELCVQNLREVQDLQFSKEEYERAIGYAISSLEIGFETPADLQHWYTPDFVTGRALESPEEFIAKLKNVKQSDLARIKDQFFAGSNWVVSLVGNGITAQKDEYKKIMDKYFGK